MKTIESKTPFCKSLSLWATLWMLAFGIFLAAPAFLVPTVLGQSTYEPYTFTTLAGNAGNGHVDGAGSAARFNRPTAMAIDRADNLYVVDGNEGSGSIRKVTPSGVVTTLARPIYFPRCVAVDRAGTVYMACLCAFGSPVFYKMTPAGVVTPVQGLVDETGGAAQFALPERPESMAVDSTDNVYVADAGNHTILRIAPDGVVVTLAGPSIKDENGNPVGGYADGTGSEARFNQPSGVAVDSAGNVYVADTYNQTIRKVTPAGVVTTLAGLSGTLGSTDGTGSGARFNYPYGVAVSSAGDVYVSDAGDLESPPALGVAIRKVTPAGVVTTLFGSGSAGSADGTGSAARFSSPQGVAVDGAGNVYVTDNNTIRKLTPHGVVTTLAGRAGSPGMANGTGSVARFAHPRGVAADSAGNVYVADGKIRKVTSAGVVTTLAGPGGDSGLALDGAGNLYVTDNNTIRKRTPEGVITTLAGLAGSIGVADGTGSEARFNQPNALALDSTGNVYVADTGNNTIRKVTALGVVTTLAGNASITNRFGNPLGAYADGTGSAARFSEPRCVAVDSVGNLYVTDAGNNTIRKGFPTSSIPAPMLMPPSLSAGQFGFGITGLPGLAVDIESSMDLFQWQVIGNYVLEGGTNFVVSPTLAQGTQFYRGHVR